VCIVVRQTAGTTDILCVVGVNNVATGQRFRICVQLVREGSN
jgi:hypothetical protein